LIAVPSRVSFLGPRGTFTEEALFSQEDLAAASHEPAGSIGEVFDAVGSASVDLGLVPIENAIEGTVRETIDTLAFESDLLIQREIERPISLHLFARPGTQLDEVKSVISIPMATAQCRLWFHEKLPGVRLEAANSTAEAAAEIARSRRAGIAGVGPALAASMYGLDVLAPDIADHPDNATRFVLLGRDVPAPTGHDKTSIVCFQEVDRPGSLLAILHEFAARSINLTRLESRPTKRGLGDYCFVIDAEGHIADELLADALRNLIAKHTRIKFLGSYPVAAGEHADGARRARSRAWRSAVQTVDTWRGLVAR
jgi:prephenate dehydratase